MPCNYYSGQLKLPIFDARFSKKFIFNDEREARSEGEKGLFIETRQDSTIRRKVTRKKNLKFTILLDGYSFVYFSLVIEAFRISASIIAF